jgi:hypothetical protein
MPIRRTVARAALAGALTLLIAGCGDKAASNGAVEQESGPATSAATAAPELSGSGGGITVIDAARGDDSAMPADSEAPTAYDRARSSEARERRSADAAGSRDDSVGSVAEDEVAAPPATADPVGNGL